MSKGLVDEDIRSTGNIWSSKCSRAKSDDGEVCMNTKRRHAPWTSRDLFRAVQILLSPPTHSAVGRRQRQPAGSLGAVPGVRATWCYPSATWLPLNKEVRAGFGGLLVGQLTVFHH